eukprot:10817119-Ditylum_brightwellii.AAC.1
MEGNSTAISSHHQVTPPQAPGVSTNKEAKEVLYRHVAHDCSPEEKTTQRVRRVMQHDPVALPPLPNRR